MNVLAGVIGAATSMTGWHAAAWGAGGGFIVEALYYVTALRAAPGWPWTRKGEPGLWPSLVAVALRIASGSVLAAAASTSGQAPTALVALLVGAATPIIMPPLLQAVGASMVELMTRLITPARPPRVEAERTEAVETTPAKGDHNAD